MDGDLAFDLLTPAPIFGIDAVKTFLGIDLEYVLKPMLRPGKKPSKSTTGQRILPLRLPEGEGYNLPLRNFGALGFRNVEGRLCIYLPLQLQRGFEEKVALQYRGDAKPFQLEGVSVVGYGLDLPPGTMVSIPIPVLGSIGLMIPLSAS